MISKRPSYKPDFFVVLLLVVAVGLTATISYQANLYFNNSDLSMARHAQNIFPDVGG